MVVNRRTGEVCIASATCIPRADLSALTPVLLVGRGGGVTQAALDGGANKVRIWEGLLAGDSPEEILELIRDEDTTIASRQFGIVDFEHEPLSFTGRQAGRARKGVAGAVGDLAYAIQGNVLASERVIDECEAVLRASTGDTAQRVMSAMVRARELGGDGRCSCGVGSLGDCGDPPPDFEKSAHIAFLLVARIGDVDGTCVVGENCGQRDGIGLLRRLRRTGESHRVAQVLLSGDVHAADGGGLRRRRDGVVGWCQHEFEGLFVAHRSEDSDECFRHLCQCRG